MTERFTLEDWIVMGDGEIVGVYFKDNQNKELLESDDIVRIANELAEENQGLKNDCGILVQSNQEYRKENEQLKQQMQTILKLTKKIEDCTHDIKMIGDVE